MSHRSDRALDQIMQVYDWRCAPAHLRTRRQLAAAGLRPGGQDIAGMVPFRRYGREQVAYLYDLRLALPKRSATPAQLAALAKATREHQLRAAERHGIARSEFDIDNDPGSGWDVSTSPIGAEISCPSSHFPSVTAAGKLSTSPCMSARDTGLCTSGAASPSRSRR